VAESPHTLHILYPDGTHHAISIVQATFTFGRGPENDLQLPDAQVSRRHARLLVEDEHVVLIDLKSANGTMIAGDRLDAEVPSLGSYLTIQFTPNRSVHMPKPAPPTAFSNGMVICPPSDSMSKILRAPSVL